MKIIIKRRLQMKVKLGLFVLIALSFLVIGYDGAIGSSFSGNMDLITAIQQRSPLDVSAFLQATWNPPMDNDVLMYIDISPNPYDDDVATGWMIEPNFNAGIDLFGFVLNNYLVVRSWDESGLCFILRVASPTTVDGFYYDEDEETILTFNMDAWSPPTTLPEYLSWFWEDFDDGEANNWVPTDPSWIVIGDEDDFSYDSFGIGIPGWRGSYYAYQYDAADAGLTYRLEVSGNGTLVFFADPADPEGYCYEFSINNSPPATYTLRKIIDDIPTNLIDPTPSVDIDDSTSDLTVVADMVAEGLKITLYIDDMFQASVIDTTPYTSGVVGIGIHDATGWESIGFDYILLHRLSPGLEPPPPEAVKESSGKPKRANGFFGR
jgi:hypothetical protein